MARSRSATATGASQRIAWAAPGTPGATRARRRGARSTASRWRAAACCTSADACPSERFTAELLLRSLADGSVRRLACFPERRRRVGHLDLDATRATLGRAADAARLRGAPARPGADRRARPVTGAELGARLREGDLAAAPAALNLLENRPAARRDRRAAGRGGARAARRRGARARRRRDRPAGRRQVDAAGGARARLARRRAHRRGARRRPDLQALGRRAARRPHADRGRPRPTAGCSSARPRPASGSAGSPPPRARPRRRWPPPSTSW